MRTVFIELSLLVAATYAQLNNVPLPMNEWGRYDVRKGQTQQRQRTLLSSMSFSLSFPTIDELSSISMPILTQAEMQMILPDEAEIDIDITDPDGLSIDESMSLSVHSLTQSVSSDGPEEGITVDSEEGLDEGLNDGTEGLNDGTEVLKDGEEVLDGNFQESKLSNTATSLVVGTVIASTLLYNLANLI